MKDSEIDFSDIPELTDFQLSNFKKRGRPIIGDSQRKAVSIRIEENVLDKLKSKAKQKGVAYQSLINEILKNAV
jgi:predicted DNA binding CopG/RHH family protein